MDEKRLAELKKFIGTISDPKISAFIDLKKLCDSGIYNLSVQMATEHAAKHHDFSFLERILLLLDGSKHASDFISSLRPKLDFVITGTKPRKFKKATPEQVANASKQVTATPTLLKAAPTKKKEKSKASNDLMDSRLMLPGCYGAGRKR